MRARDRHRLERLGPPDYLSVAHAAHLIDRARYYLYPRLPEIEGVVKIAGTIRIPRAGLEEWIRKNSEPYKANGHGSEVEPVEQDR